VLLGATLTIRGCRKRKLATLGTQPALFASTLPVHFTPNHFLATLLAAVFGY
jgi:hypothetical protein